MEIIYSDLRDYKISPSKPLPLGNRLIRWCKANKYKKAHILMRITHNSNIESFENILAAISVRLDPQFKSVLGGNYEDELKKSFNALGISDTGYLFITASNPAGSVFLPDHLTYVKTTKPDITGKEDVIAPKLPTRPARKGNLIECLQGTDAANLREYTILLNDDEATIKSPDREKGKEFFFDSLLELKEQLFDAPEEVKKNFNNVVNYFSSIIQ